MTWLKRLLGLLLGFVLGFTGMALAADALPYFTQLTTGAQTVIWTGVLAIPTAILAHRLAMRRQQDKAEAARDAVDLEALKARDVMIVNLNTQLVALSERIGSLSAKQSSLEDELRIVTNRERALLLDVAALTERLKHYDACTGGQPCPFTRRHT